LSPTAWENVAFWSVVWSNAGLFAATIILIVGLLGEYNDPESSRAVRVRWSFTKFEYMVVLGVAGELLFNGLIFASSMTLEVLHSTEVAQINRIASEAYKVGNTARENAAFAFGRAVFAELNAGEAYKIAGEAIERIESLRRENTILIGRLHGIDVLTGERDMNDAERARLKASLKGRKHEITVVTVNDLEANRYAVKIIAALSAAGAIVKIENTGSLPESGVVVCVNDRDDVRVANALNLAGIVIRRVNQKDKNRPETCDRPPNSTPPGA